MSVDGDIWAKNVDSGLCRAATVAGGLSRKIASYISQGSALAHAVAFRTGPIAGAPAGSRLEGTAALLDPAIKPRPGPFGKVGVILLVGLTRPELDEIARAAAAKLIADIAADPARQIT